MGCRWEEVVLGGSKPEQEHLTTDDDRVEARGDQGAGLLKGSNRKRHG